MVRQGGHRSPAHGFVLFPMFPLAVGVTVVGLGALPALGQVVTVLAALETLDDGDPQALLLDVFLLFRDVLGDGVRRGAAVRYLLRVGSTRVARRTVRMKGWAMHDLLLFSLVLVHVS